MKRSTSTTPTLFDDQRAPAPAWQTQGNPLFESRKPLPLERVAGLPDPIIMTDDDEFTEPTDEPDSDVRH